MADEEIEVLVKNVYKSPGTDTLTICLIDLEPNLARKKCLLVSTIIEGALPIIGALANIVYTRPIVHQILQKAIDGLGGIAKKIVITELREGIEIRNGAEVTNGIFHAEITVIKPDGQKLRLDSRSTDAIAFALHAPCPIYVRKTVWERSCIPYIKFFPDEDPFLMQGPQPENTPNTENTGSITLEEMPTHDLKKMEQIFKDLPKPDKGKLS